MTETNGILDDIQAIKSIDRMNMCEIQLRFPESAEDAIKRANKLRIPKNLKIGKRIIHYHQPENILVLGMGGSAIGGELLRGWLRKYSQIPIEVNHDYYLPAYADANTLVLAVSYSGDTEETLSGFVEAVSRKCMIVGISSGGLLEKFCQSLRVPFLKLPSGMPPRTALPYLFFPLVLIVKKFGIAPKMSEVKEALVVLKQLREEIKPEIPTSNNPSKQLAAQLYGGIPVIYGFQEYYGVAMRIKTQFNENAKVPAKYEVFPELNHNETVGWEGPKELTKLLNVVLLRDPNEPPEIQIRVEAIKKLTLNQKAGKVLEIYPRGKTTLAKMLSTVYIGDFASVYLAILYGVDPTPVEIINKMKYELRKKTDIVTPLSRQITAFLKK
ncbi:bifunctional phosphoglucose/phosphomannose isomerase [Candidatus Bathyarchaeota archaeon]|nr:bifunctional phosphoglucose/phosphomannose isomerase [Candidatus Bathyarchaeota archaeon]